MSNAAAAATTAPAALRRRWLAPEVVQTSSMDCGPAALKCLLEGFHIRASYGRLREACQTDVDGTSIDTLEVVAQQLGLHAEQHLLPTDHVALPQLQTLPALVVVRHADWATHFVVVWRRVGPWLQVMDPAGGRRWVHVERWLHDIYVHDMAVDASDWRAWAESDEFLAGLHQRMRLLGLSANRCSELSGTALADAGWFGIGTLDAAVRLMHALVRAQGVQRGTQAERLLVSMVHTTHNHLHDIYHAIPVEYWSVRPDASNTDSQRERLRVRGAVLLQVSGRASGEAAPDGETPMSEELAAVLHSDDEQTSQTVWRLLRDSGRAAPWVLAAAVLATTLAVMFEALLFRGLFDMANHLALPSQRLLAALALLAFLGVMVMVEWSIVGETLRLGRHLDLRLRTALLDKLPRLHDRYFQSRPISDMADRSHGIQIARGVPQLMLQGWQTVLELLITWWALSWIAPGSAGWALALVAVALILPLLAQPFLNERDMRVRNHAAALNGFYLDALLGLVPVRVHHAERNVRRQHEGLLVDWAASLRGGQRLAIACDALQGLLCVGLAGALLMQHFKGQGGVSGNDLLLVFWTVKLPALAQRLANLAQQIPAQRNALLRLMEPLSAPEENSTSHEAPSLWNQGQGTSPSVHLSVHNGVVRAGGHDILREVQLHIAAGEHVAVVGASGAGKSSLLGALLGWHRLTEGELQVDGVTVHSDNIQALRQITAWVDPGVQVWNRSLADNLLYGSPDNDLGRIGPALQAAQLLGVARKLPSGLQSLLGEGGALLSGGEGQRVRLARALLGTSTRLVLLDEPFRGLDRDQRRALLEECRRWWRDQTLLCVTHDLSETLAFDRVLVVEKGRIVEDGVPSELAQQQSHYQALLAAEETLREQLWQGDAWRRLTLQDGHLHDVPAATNQKHGHGH